jgi:hypothetical protein
MESHSSTSQVSLNKLTLTLLVTAFCSQALPAGLNLLVSAGMENMGYAGPSAVAQSNFYGLLALAFMLAGPFFYGLYIRSGWGGLRIGFLGLLGEIGGFLFSVLIGYLIGSPPEIVLSLLFIFPALGEIVVMLWAAGKIRSIQERNGIGLAIAIGIGMSIGLAILVTISQALVGRTQGPAGYLIFFLPFLWIWLSTVFFPEFLSHRTDQRGLVIWIAAMLIFTFVIFELVFHAFSGPGF